MSLFPCHTISYNSSHVTPKSKQLVPQQLKYSSFALRARPCRICRLIPRQNRADVGSLHGSLRAKMRRIPLDTFNRFELFFQTKGNRGCPVAACEIYVQHLFLDLLITTPHSPPTYHSTPNSMAACLVSIAVVVLVLQKEVFVGAVSGESNGGGSQTGEPALESVPAGECSLVSPGLTAIQIR